MAVMDIFSKMLEKKLVVIARRLPEDMTEGVIDAVIDGGVCFVESTFDQSAPDCIEKNMRTISKMVEAANGRAHIGAGTVLTVEQVRAAHKAGAEYIISPNTNREVIEETRKLGMISIPGAMTPTEIEQAYTWGAHIVKLFPADDMGIHYIKNITAPLSHIPLMATGGVNPDTIPEFHEAGAKAFGTGVTILTPDCIRDKNYDGIRVHAKEHVDVISALKEV